jgi:hypothetical protein
MISFSLLTLFDAMCAYYAIKIVEVLNVVIRYAVMIGK